MSMSPHDSMKINLWVSGSVDSSANGGWSYLLHCKIAGMDFTNQLGGFAANTTPTQMALFAALNALSSLKAGRQLYVVIHTNIYQLSTSLEKNMHNWANNDWKTTKGLPPRHVELWQQIYAILTDTSRILSYQVILQNEQDVADHYRLAAIRHSEERLNLGKQINLGLSTV